MWVGDVSQESSIKRATFTFYSTISILFYALVHASRHSNLPFCEFRSSLSELLMSLINGIWGWMTLPSNGPEMPNSNSMSSISAAPQKSLAMARSKKSPEWRHLQPRRELPELRWKEATWSWGWKWWNTAGWKIEMIETGDCSDDLNYLNIK